MPGGEDHSLDAAYALDGTPEAARAYYRGWAKDYDAEFIDRLGYVYPALLAMLFLERSGPADTPVLDIGCGSGAVGIGLAGRRVDGIDLSPEMLQVACEKGLYTRLIEGDLLGTLPLEDGMYRGLVSAGTFTHGHVGPEALGELIRVAAPDALFCLGVNAEHFATHGFRQAFDDLHRSGTITEAAYEERQIYAGDHEHAQDRALVAVFRKS